MAFRYHKRNSVFRHVTMLVAMPLVLTGTAYALFSQQLSVNASATVPAYTSSQNLSISYTKNITSKGQGWQYDISVTVKNNGAGNTTAWQSTFDLPGDYSNVTCTNATCTQANGVNTAVNTGTNGNIPPNGTATYSFSFKSALQTFQFTSITVSGTLAPVYQTISGLTVSASVGTRTKQGKIYTWPYTFTVTNASGQNLAGWRILAPWDTSTNSVNSMPATVNYAEAATQLTILSTQPINNSTNFQFTANLSSTNSAWALTGYTVEGQQ